MQHKPRPAVAYRIRNRYNRFIFFETLVSQKAEKLTCSMKTSGGSWSGKTGNGQAYRDGDNKWYWTRDIRRGQWAGPWTRRRIDADE